MTREQALKLHTPEALMMFMAKNNEPTWNLIKATEEASEFTEAVTKQHTKSSKNPKKPSRQDVLEEYSDLVFRGRVYVQSLFLGLDFDDVTDMIVERITSKQNSLFKHLEEKKYDGRL